MAAVVAVGLRVLGRRKGDSPLMTKVAVFTVVTGYTEPYIDSLSSGLIHALASSLMLALALILEVKLGEWVIGLGINIGADADADVEWWWWWSNRLVRGEDVIEAEVDPERECTCLLERLDDGISSWSGYSSTHPSTSPSSTSSSCASEATTTSRPRAFWPS
jgi:hypothetical protein